MKNKLPEWIWSRRLSDDRGKMPTPYGTIESGWEKGHAPYLKLPAGIRMK